MVMFMFVIFACYGSICLMILLSFLLANALNLLKYTRMLHGDYHANYMYLDNIPNVVLFSESSCLFLFLSTIRRRQHIQENLIIVIVIPELKP